MTRITATLLALGLASAIGTATGPASAQSRDYYPPANNVQGSGAYYDYARVVRVDPVIVNGYRGGGYNNSGYSNGGYDNSAYAGNAQRCYTRQDSYAGNDGDYDDGYRDDGYRSDGYRNDDYRNEGYGNTGSNTGRTVATVIGGVLGAAIGSQVGGGSARYATSAIGSMVGGIAGRQVYENAQRQQRGSGVVQVCDPVPVDRGGYVNAGDSRVVAYDVTYEYAGRQYTTRSDHNPGNRIRVRVDVQPE